MGDVRQNSGPKLTRNSQSVNRIPEKIMNQIRSGSTSFSASQLFCSYRAATLLGAECAEEPFSSTTDFSLSSAANHLALTWITSVALLGFRRSIVSQVNPRDCEIILCQHATRKDKARLFIELNATELADLRREIVERSVPSKETWWGYDSIQIDDPDGNELLFPIEGNSPATVA
jgi:hypothetical protein